MKFGGALTADSEDLSSRRVPACRDDSAHRRSAGRAGDKGAMERGETGQAAIYGISARSLAENIFARSSRPKRRPGQRSTPSSGPTYVRLRQWMLGHYDLCQNRGFVGCGRVVETAWEHSRVFAVLRPAISRSRGLPPMRVSSSGGSDLATLGRKLARTAFAFRSLLQYVSDIVDRK
jgi:hypothetical protein